MLKILHTSDWHLGRRLYGHTRYQEFAAFLDWLYDCLVKESIDVLIVAGDIFDSMTPSNKAQALYYEFLGRVSVSQCQHIIIVAGNHDSPSLLDAPKNVLKFLNVHIIGTACEHIEEEVITLQDKNGQPQAIILAVPYLRDKDVRHSVSGESSRDKQAQLVAGISKHYAQASKIAKHKQAMFTSTANKTNEIAPFNTVPIIATGHLMALGGKTTADDGVRELYVGNLGGISANIFDPDIDYVALGHLHVPQLVGGNEHIRYSGSPIAMGFGEAKQQKQVLLIEFLAKQDFPKITLPATAKLNELTNDYKAQCPLSANTIADDTQQLDNISKSQLKNNMTVTPITVPTFHKLAQIIGDMTQITQQINTLKTLDEPVWVEVIYQSNEVITNLSEQLAKLVTDSKIDIIKIKNTQTYQRLLKQNNQSESLQDLTKNQVFERCLEAHKVDKNQRDELMACFEEIVFEIEHEDARAE